MLQWRRLLVLEEFENGRLPKIVPDAFGKMGSKSTLDFGSHRKLLRRNEGNIQFDKMLVHSESTAVWLLSVLFARYVMLLNANV